MSPAVIGCQCASTPRGPRFFEFGAPVPNSQIAENSVIQPKNATAITRYPIRTPNTADRMRYTLPMKMTNAAMTVR